MRKTRQQQIENTDERQRRQNFKREVIFGPIFICSCCERCKYENGVTKITEKFKEKVEAKRGNLIFEALLECNKCLLKLIHVIEITLGIRSEG